MNSTIQISRITTDPALQSRVAINQAVVDEYAALRADSFPPIVLFHDGENYHQADGEHRRLAAVKRGDKTISCEIRKGSKRDAILYSLSANAHHGLQRGPADKRKSCETLLADAEWGQKSIKWIAEQAKVSLSFAQGIAKEHTAKVGSPEKRLGRDGKLRPAKRKPTIRVVDGDEPDEPPSDVPPMLQRDREPGDESEHERSRKRAKHEPDADLDELKAPYIDALKMLDRIHWWLKGDMSEPKTGAHLAAPFGRIEKALADARRGIAQASPAAWCPKCDRKGCAKCRQTGWLPKSVWDGLPEAEKK